MGNTSLNELRLLVAEHLPAVSDRVLRMADEDEDFKELISDYFDCFKEISKMKDSDQEKRKSQFLETMGELKSELDSYLMENDD